MRPHLTIALALSASIHAALITVAALATQYRAPSDTLGGGGQGGDVIVTFVADGSGGDSMLEVGSTHAGGGSKRGATGRALRRKMMMSARKSDAREQLAAIDKNAIEGSIDAEGGGNANTPSTGTPGPLSAGSGGGAGGGHGGGIGPGRGRGNLVLSQIWVKINRSKYYPWIARKNGWEGAPRVRFAVNKFGQVEQISLARSCGITELDEAAIETIKRSAPLPNFPQPITLAIRYSMRE